MALTAGTISIVSVHDYYDSLSSAAATMGSTPYTYQWYRSTMEGFTPGGGNVVSGATALTLNDTGLVPETTYYYLVVVTDALSAHATSNQLEVTTLMALTAGAISQVSVSQTTDSLASAVATMGSSPYTYQWYRNVVGSATIGSSVSGATALTLNDSSLIPGTVYWYHVIVTDALGSVATSAGLSVTTLNPSVISPNAFTEGPFLGMLDQRYNYNTKEAAVDSTQVGTVYAGQAMKFPASPVLGGVPQLIACSAITDVCMGFIVFDIKNQGYAAPGLNGQLGAAGTCSRFELAQDGDVIYLFATEAITRGARVCLDVSSPGGVSATGHTANLVGWAYDGATASGQLIRVQLTCPNYSNV